MPAQLDGKVAIVTGGAGGIGRATAAALIQHGARVVLADLAADAGREAAEALGGSSLATFVETDVSDEASVQALIDETLRVYGRLDIAHNNAGIDAYGSPLHEVTTARFERVLDVNVLGLFFAMRAEITAMLESGGGSIINTASTLGLIAIPQQSAYVASKHAVIGLTKAAALEYGSAGIRINAVLPGIIKAPMFEAIAADVQGLEEMVTSMLPAGRIGLPEEVAAAVVWLASDAASYVTGVSLPIDGGSLTS